MDNGHIILQCDLYNIIELERGCCGQFLHWDTTKWFWKSWKKKFFQCHALERFPANYYYPG